MSVVLKRKQNHYLSRNDPGFDPWNLDKYWFVAIFLVYININAWETRCADDMSPKTGRIIFHLCLRKVEVEATIPLVGLRTQWALEPNDYRYNLILTSIINYYYVHILKKFTDVNLVNQKLYKIHARVHYIYIYIYIYVY